MNTKEPIPLEFSEQEIVVKFLWKGSYVSRQNLFSRQLPASMRWGPCRFVFDPAESKYDWLVVYDDLPIDPQNKRKQLAESLSCSPQHTLLITVEPSSIKTYGFDFLDQFAVVLTSQEPWAITNSHTTRTQPALRWFYGDSTDRLLSYDRLTKQGVSHKSGLISTVCSAKRQTHTLHAQRYAFTWKLKERIPELEIFGRGVRPLADKAQALSSYRYHVAVENHICPHHWTEKLADVFLGYALPFYCGCPNVADYFPRESYIPIDIHDLDAAARTIREAIDTHQFERRLPAIVEARRLVLEQYNLFAVLAREIQAHDTANTSEELRRTIYSRRQVRTQNLTSMLRFGWEYVRIRSRNRLQSQTNKAA